MGTYDDSSLNLQQVLLQICLSLLSIRLSLGSVNENSELFAGDGSVDVHGKPAQKSKTGSWRACFFILGNEFCERLAFTSIEANLVTYLIRRMRQGNASAARLASTWSGTSYLTPFIGGLLADSYLGRYWTIVPSSIIYIMGMCALTLSASVPALKPDDCTIANCISVTPVQYAVFFTGLYLVAVGMGGIKPCMPSFGADQFDSTDTNERMMKESFFNSYMFFACFGALVSNSFFVWVQENIGWGIGYGIPTVFMGIAVASFLSGTPFYRFQKPAVNCRNPLLSTCQVIVASVRKCSLNLPKESSLLYETLETGNDHQLEHTQGLRFLDKAAILTDEERKTGNFSNRWRLCSVTQAEELKIVIRLFPIWLFGIIDRAAVAQTPIIIEQGMVMERRVGPFTLPAASLATANVIAATVWIPIYDRLLIPLTRKFTGNPTSGLSDLQRIGIGYALTAIAMMFSALVEMRRLQLAKELGLVNQNVAVPLNILWQVPQYVLLGISNVLVQVGKLELFNDESPVGMRSLSTAFILIAITLGSYLSSFVLMIVSKVTTAGGEPGWIPDNLNHGRLDVYFWFWAGVCLLNLILYVLCSMRYERRKVSTNLL